MGKFNILAPLIYFTLEIELYMAMAHILYNFKKQTSLICSRHILRS